MFELIDKRIRRAFSDAAIQYDVLTSLHKEIGRELVAKINQIDSAEHILDIGMGTGWLTNRLTFFFPDSKVVGIDFADGMIECARKKFEEIKIVQADARALPFKPQAFDLAVSNLAYQWMRDLPHAFSGINNILKENGKFIFTMFGEQTLKELFESIEKNAVSKNGHSLISRSPSLAEVEAALKRAGFREVKSDYEIIKVHFPDMLDLLKWIRDIGANSVESDVFLGKDLLNRANQHYETHFKDRLGIRATFEVLWLEARK